MGTFLPLFGLFCHHLHSGDASSVALQQVNWNTLKRMPWFPSIWQLTFGQI